MRWTVGARLLSSFLLLAIVVLLLGILSTQAGQRTAQQVKQLYQAVQGTAALGEAAAAMHRARGQSFYHVAAEDSVTKGEIERAVGEIDVELDKYLADATVLIEGNESRRAQLERVRNSWHTFQERRQEEVFPASRASDDRRALNLMVSRTGPALAEATGELDQLLAETRQANERVYRGALSAIQSARTLTLWGTILLTALALFMAWILSRGISRRIRNVSDAALAISEGSTAHRVEVSGDDEISALGRSFNRMTNELAKQVEREREMAEEQVGARERLTLTVDRYGEFVRRVARGELDAVLDRSADGELAELGGNLEKMVGALRTMTLRIHETVSSLSSSTAQILTTAQQHSASAAESASAVTETVATVDQVSQMAHHNAERAREVAVASQQSAEAQRHGRQAIDRTVSSMNHLSNQVSSIASRILTLSEQAQAVGQIITTVNELAEQSNLLALNASIEAARAGEEGRGFAVVAQEIRALAEQSKRATAQVRGILGDIQKSTSSAVLVTEEGNKAVAAVVEEVRASGAQIERLAQVIEEAREAAQHILTSAQQQVDGMKHISQAMTSINQATAQGVEGARQTEHSARELNALSVRLREAASQYRA